MDVLRKEIQMHEELCRKKDKQIEELNKEVKRLKTTLLFVRAANMKRPSFPPPAPPKKKVTWEKDESGNWVLTGLKY